MIKLKIKLLRRGTRAEWLAEYHRLEALAISVAKSPWWSDEERLELERRIAIALDLSQ